MKVIKRNRRPKPFRIYKKFNDSKCKLLILIWYTNNFGLFRGPVSISNLKVDGERLLKLKPGYIARVIATFCRRKGGRDGKIGFGYCKSHGALKEKNGVETECLITLAPMGLELLAHRVPISFRYNVLTIIVQREYATLSEIGASLRVGNLQKYLEGPPEILQGLFEQEKRKTKTITYSEVRYWERSNLSLTEQRRRADLYGMNW